MSRMECNEPDLQKAVPGIKMSIAGIDARIIPHSVIGLCNQTDRIDFR